MTILAVGTDLGTNVCSMVGLVMPGALCCVDE